MPESQESCRGVKRLPLNTGLDGAYQYSAVNRKMFLPTAGYKDDRQHIVHQTLLVGQLPSPHQIWYPIGRSDQQYLRLGLVHLTRRGARCINT